MTILAVRYWTSDSDEPVIEQVRDEEQQAALVAFMILDLGRPTAEPVTLVPQPDPALLAKIRRDIVEHEAVEPYADDEIDDTQAHDVLARLAPALRDTDGTDVFEALEHAVDAYLSWMKVQDPNFEIRSVEPELRDGELLVTRYRVLLDEALDDLLRALDACTSQEAGDHTDTETETRGAA